MKRLCYGSFILLVLAGCMVTENNFPATIDNDTKKTMEELNRLEEQALNINVNMKTEVPLPVILKTHAGSEINENDNIDVVPVPLPEEETAENDKGTTGGSEVTGTLSTP